MVKINRFCAECGALDKGLFDNFCQDCYWKLNSLTNPTSRSLNFTICNDCFSVKLRSGWTYIKNIEDISLEIANSSIKFLNIAEECYVDIEEITQVDWSNPKPEFAIKYAISSNNIDEFDTHIEYDTLEVAIDRGICKICVSKKSGGATTVVQLRAENRDLTQNEIKKYSNIAIKLTHDNSSENPTAYLSDILQNHGGLDYHFGNQWIAENFMTELQKNIVGHREKNFKLVTEDKQGQRVYSVTYLYRIPEIKPGDYIEFENDLHNVVTINNNSVVLRSLVSRHKIKIHDWKSLYSLKNIPEETSKVVLSKDYTTDTYMFMDTQSFLNEEVETSRFPIEIEVGTDIKLLKWNNKYYLPL